jgi:2-polyprenyl-6-methoxyphenol hydroxylase-like FAD-dependent oxidoreductase
MTGGSREETTVCVVGGGPAGMILSLLLARQGIRVTLLESHDDFDREFRGDTLHSTTMELMDELGLTERVERIVHSKLSTFTLVTPTQKLDFVHLDWLKSPHPYVGLVPQVEFLDLLADEARRYAAFDLRMNTPAQGILEENGVVVGVTYKTPEGVSEIRAKLVVGADGRGSRMRSAGGFELVKTAAPMDVLWFQVPTAPGDEALDPFALRFGSGVMAVTFNRRDRWQIGFIILKGSAKELRQAGIAKFRSDLGSILPEMRARFEAVLTGWDVTQVLGVQVGRVVKWYRPGMLLIGDAAHIMSPAGGVGINYAIQDAVATANRIIDPLKAGTLDVTHLAAVQAKRERPTRIMQWLQNNAQKRVIGEALKGDRPFRIPAIARLARALPLVRRIPGHVVGRGFGVEKLRHREPQAG